MRQDIAILSHQTPGRTAQSPSLATESITKSYGQTQVLEELSLEVGQGEFVSLLGPSGCGKTTTLNIVSGFVTPDSGRVFIDGREVTREAAHKRDSSVVFQNYALFPHLTVEKNIKYGLKAKKIPAAEMKERVAWALRLVAIEELRDRYPGQLSGGQQQRVAVARSLVMHPGVLLMDEPFSNLDAKLRSELRLELKAVQRKLGQSVLFVTHDQVEALSLSDRIMVMNKGHVEQVGEPREVYERPRTAFVARFMGVENVYELTRQGSDYTTGAGLRFGRGVLGTDCSAVGIRPSSVAVLSDPTDSAGVWRAEGVISSMTYLGEGVRYEVAVGAEAIAALVSDTRHPFAPGQHVHLEAHRDSLLPLAE